VILLAIWLLVLGYTMVYLGTDKLVGSGDKTLALALFGSTKAA